MNTNYHNIIKEICAELKIKFSLLSNDWIMVLQKENKIRYIVGYKFDLNTQGTSNIVDDKFALYEILKNNDIPIIEHNILYKQTNNNDYAKGLNDYNVVTKIFKQNNRHIVIKSNTGTCGNEVYNITHEEEIRPTLEKLFQKHHSISICPYYEIENEYRIIVLKDEILLIYKKIKPTVKGNGISSIKELLLDFNYNYFKDKLNEEYYNTILKENELYEYNWQFNLSKGAKIGKVDKDIEKNITLLATKVAKQINLGFGSVDIIKTIDNKLLVMEANSGVMMKNYIENEEDGYKIAKNVYKKAIEAMFE